MKWEIIPLSLEVSKNQKEHESQQLREEWEVWKRWREEKKWEKSCVYITKAIRIAQKKSLDICMKR
jgi:hypothetical protein